MEASPALMSPKIRMHSYTSAAHDVNFNTNDPLGWEWISDPLFASGEAASFYVPLIVDPKVIQHVWDDFAAYRALK